MGALLEREHVEEVVQALPRSPGEPLDDLVDLDVLETVSAGNFVDH